MISLIVTAKETWRGVRKQKLKVMGCQCNKLEGNSV